MTKVCQAEFPMGTFSSQKSDGYEISELKRQVLHSYAKNITNDHQFVGLYSGNGTVRNGKSTVAQQDGYYYSKEVSKVVKHEIPFTTNNIVFKADKLIETAMKLPQYSCIILDEGDDLTSHHMSKMAAHIKRFFRKCGQLNLFVILILPEFFEFPKQMAINRTNYLCNVKFQRGTYNRGYYDFYGKDKKRGLYIKGKKFLNYNAVKADFKGTFSKLYTVDEEEYRKKKKDDLIDDDTDGAKISVKQIEMALKAELLLKFRQHLPKITYDELALPFGTSVRTLKRYKNVYRLDSLGKLVNASETVPKYDNIGDKEPYMAQVPHIAQTS